MTWQWFAVVAGSLLWAVDTSKEESKKALDPLQGTWVATGGEQEGNPFPEAGLKNMKLVVSGDQYTFTSDSPEEKGVLKPDPSKSPKALDIDIKEGEQKGQSQKAIYELDGDTLKICFTQPGNDRPSEMAAKAGSKCVMIVFKKEKP
jgi:uncharacterized protein (TIGR03067 family)